MPTSTLIQYSVYATQYAWDAVTGYLLNSGGFLFFVVLLLIVGVVMVTVGIIKGIFMR